jgi:hypothetical protein
MSEVFFSELDTFGSVMRFAFGEDFTARKLGHALLKRFSESWSEVSAQRVATAAK